MGRQGRGQERPEKVSRRYLRAPGRASPGVGTGEGVQTASKMPSEGRALHQSFNQQMIFNPKREREPDYQSRGGSRGNIPPQLFWHPHQRTTPPQNEDTEDTEDTKKNPEQKIQKSEHMKKIVSLCPCVLKGFKNARDIHPLPCYYCIRKGRRGRGYILRTARKPAWTQGHEDTSAPSQVRGGTDPRCVHRVPGVLVSLGSRTDFPGVPLPLASGNFPQRCLAGLAAYNAPRPRALASRPAYQGG